MVKKILSVFAIASMMLATSCSNDEFDSIQTGNEATVSFTAQLPDGLQTKSRAYGDGTTATTLTYAVYEVNGNNWTLRGDLGVTDETINMTETVSLRLVNGNEYAVVFWADAPESIYSFSAENCNVTADYTKNNGVESNNEELDAFFAVEKITVNGAASKNVELKRPFAQLNIGTADLAAAKAAGHEVKQAGIKVKTYNTLNFKDGSVSGESDVTFALADLPTTPEKFPVDGYDYLTMNYLLMPTDKQTVDVTLNCGGVESRTFQNVPLQRNYRTNIYGNLLTSNEDFNVEIKPGFDGDYNKDVETVTAEALKTLLTASNNVTLDKDYVVTGNWTPILIHGAYVLNGNNHTISGLTNGLFCSEGSNLTIENLTIANSVLNTTKTLANGLGNAAFVTYCNLASSLTLKNCHAVNVTVNGVNEEDAVPGVAALVGYSDGETTTISNCSVEKCNITGYDGNAAGIIGMYGYNKGLTVENCVVSNVKLTAHKTTKIGDIIGSVVSGSATLKNNTYSNKPYGRTVDATITIDGATPVTSESELKAVLAGGCNIILLNDITLGENWTPASVNTGSVYYPLYTKTCVIDGNNHKILKLNAALLGDNYCTDLTIKNLTIDNANIEGSGLVGGGNGAFIGFMENGLKLTLDNCHLVNSHVTATKGQAGGLVGFVKDITISNCSVKGSYITGASSAAGIVGHVQTENGIATKVKNCIVNNCVITSNDKDDWRIGAIVGTVNGNGTLSIVSCTESDNTFTMPKSSATDPGHHIWGRNVGATLDIK